MRLALTVRGHRLLIATGDDIGEDDGTLVQLTGGVCEPAPEYVEYGDDEPQVGFAPLR